MFLFLPFLIFMGNLFTPAAEQTTVSVTVTRVSAQKGEIYAALFNSDKGFPNDVSAAYKTAKATPRNGTATLQFENVPQGTYAIALFHDTNGDGKLNTNFIGIPKEGYGVSNNAKNMFSGPSFKQTVFKHTTSTQLTIIMRY
jgi:uncharacterized protein (DUF2141 family)